MKQQSIVDNSVFFIIINFMKINVFCCANDIKLHSLSFFSHPDIQCLNIRAIHDMAYFDRSIVLLSEHSTNHRIIRYIRQYNVLTPIYLVSNTSNYYKEINGVMSPDTLSYEALITTLNLFPQQFIWNYVFQQDTIKRNNFILQNHSLA